MIRMLVAGGDESDRLRIARTIGRRGALRVEMTSSIEVGLGLLEWRKYDMVGAFFDTSLADRFATTCRLQDIDPQLIMFGKVLRTSRAALCNALQSSGLAQPIFIGEPIDDDAAPFWRALASCLMGTSAASSFPPANGTTTDMRRSA